MTIFSASDITMPNGEVLKANDLKGSNYAAGLWRLFNQLVNLVSWHTAEISGLFRGTSSSSIRMELGAKTVVLNETKHGFGVGSRAGLFWDTGTQVLRGSGLVIAVSGSTLTVEIDTVNSGEGLLNSNWTVAIVGEPGAAGPAGLPGGGSLQAAYDGGQSIAIGANGVTVTNDTAQDAITVSGSGSGGALKIDRTGTGTGIFFGDLQICYNGSAIQFRNNLGQRWETDGTNIIGNQGARIWFIGAGDTDPTVLPNRFEPEYGIGQDDSLNTLFFTVENSAGTDNMLALSLSKGTAEAQFQGPISRSHQNVTASTTVGSGVDSILVDSSAGPVTVTIPTGVATTHREITIRDVGGSAGTNTITVALDSGSIANATAINTSYGRLDLVYTGSQWVGYGE